MQLEQDMYERLSTVMINKSVYRIVDDYVNQPHLATNMVELMKSHPHQRMFNLVFPRTGDNECFDQMLRLVEKAIYENGLLGGLKIALGTSGAGDYAVDGNWGRFVQISLISTTQPTRVSHTPHEKNTTHNMSVQEYENDLDTFGKAVSSLHDSMGIILAIMNRSVLDVNHPMNMFTGQASEISLKISEEVHSLETLNDLVLPRVMEQCQSGAWSRMSQQQRSEWMLNRSMEHRIKADRLKRHKEEMNVFGQL